MPKFVCPIDGYEDCYIELSDSWTRAEIRGFSRENGEEYMRLVRSKIVDIKVRTTNGTIDTPEKFDDAHLDNAYWPVFQWLVVLPNLVVQDVISLGEAMRRQLLQSPEGTQDSATPAP